MLLGHILQQNGKEQANQSALAGVGNVPVPSVQSHHQTPVFSYAEMMKNNVQ